MKKVYCMVEERIVNPLFEVFDGGDFILSSYRDIEQPLTEVSIYFESGDPRPALEQALLIVGAPRQIEECEISDDDWQYAYRRHFKTEHVSQRIIVQPEWENLAVIKFDPGMAFGTGKHETTKACLQLIDEYAGDGGSFLDMGCGSGILSIAAAKLGFSPVAGFDVDPVAVDVSRENAAKNGVQVEFFRHALGSGAQVELPKADLVAANILGPLLVRYADEIVGAVKKRIIVSGILTEFYPEVIAAYASRGFAEVEKRTIGEWTSALLERA